MFGPINELNIYLSIYNHSNKCFYEMDKRANQNSIQLNLFYLILLFCKSYEIFALKCIPSPNW